jgi:hypothetical protein
MNKEIIINPIGDSLSIYEGQALQPREPKIITLIGVLNAPLLFLQQRIDQIDQKAAHILVNREKMGISLRTDETSYYSGAVYGSLEFHPKFTLFGINTSLQRSNFDLAKLFKMNRTVFESLDIAMNLISTLQNFRAKVDKEVEKLDDNRGNKRDLKAQVVDSNLPDTFNLVMPIFKGTPAYTFPVEVYINADDFSCQLISPVAADLIDEMRDSEINKVLAEIAEIAPGIVVIEQ